MIQPNLINLTFWYVFDLMVVIANYRYGGWYVPVLEFDKLGRDGDFTQPFTYRIQEFRFPEHSGIEWISRNKVPWRVKRNFIEFIKRLEAGEVVENVPQLDVCVIWTKDDVEEWKRRFPDKDPRKKLRGIHVFTEKGAA